MNRWRSGPATGSTGTAGWRGGWSDLDLLVFRDTAPASWLRDVAGTLNGPQRVKVAGSCSTTGDIDALRVPPRVVQSLRRAAEGALRAVPEAGLSAAGAKPG